MYVLKRTCAALWLLCSFWASACFAQKTLNEARPEIRLLLGDLNKAGIYFLDAQIDSAYQRAQVEIGLKAQILISKIDSSLRTANGKATYVLPTDMFRIRAILKGPATQQAFVKLVDDPYTIEKLVAAQPGTYAWIHGSILTLWSVGAGIEKLYVYYYAELTHLTSGSAVSDLPVKLRWAACNQAASYLAKGQLRWSEATAFEAEADKLISLYRSAISRIGDFPQEPQK